MSEKKNILIISGGGCKGLAQILVLKKLEEEYGPLHNRYDLVAGSSVGAINGSMVASGKIDMEYLESIYPTMIKKVFKKKWYPRIPKYDRKNFYEVWLDEIGNIKLKDCLTKMQITSVNLCDKRNHFFKSWEKDGEKLLVAEVAKSFAAPFFFGPFIDNEEKCVFFDGGMGIANIPVAYALIEAQLLWPGEQWHFDIIGSGFTNDTIPFNKAKKYKVFRQLFQYFNPDSAGLAREQVRQEQIGAIEKLAKSSSNISFDYYDIEISKKLNKLDGVKYLDEYKKIGLKMAEKPLLSIK